MKTLSFTPAALLVARAGTALGQSTVPFPAVFELSSLLPANGGNGSDGFVINGVDAGDLSGWSVSCAGDVDGDGIDDLIIGASGTDLDNGESYVVFGGAGLGAGGVIELSSLDGTNGFVLNGIDAFDTSGFSVSSAGDVNADGFDDLIIGAFGAEPNEIPFAGESYVVFGAMDIGSGGVIELSSLDGTNGFVLNGIDMNDLSGRSVSSAGDVNGDGIDDLIIGAPAAAPNGNDSGESYVVFGGEGLGSGGVIELSSLDGLSGFVINGIDEDDFSGHSVSCAGDVNDDGMDDLVIGTLTASPNGVFEAGQSYVVFGAAGLGGGGVIELSLLDGLDGFLLNGIDTQDRSGFSVSSAGDMNGDGIDDLIIGAYHADPNGNSAAGESYVVFGRANGQRWVSPTGGDWDTGLNWSTGAAPSGAFAAIDTPIGVTVTGPAGAVFLDGLFLGASLGQTTLDLQLNSLVSIGNDFTIPVSAALSGCGTLVTESAFTNDGLISPDDLNLFAASGLTNLRTVDISPLTSPSTFARLELSGVFTNGVGGETQLRQGDVELDALSGVTNLGTLSIAFASAGVLGPVINTGPIDPATVIGATGSIELSSLNGSDGFVINGIDVSDRSGGSVSCAGDVNADGIDDLIIGARRADPNLNLDAGESYVVFGAAGVGSGGEINLSSLSGTNGFVINGIDADDFSGRSVSCAGDVNADGIDDLIIGADRADPNLNSSAGESYVVFGAVGVGSGGVIELSSLNGANGFVINGIDAGDYSGVSVSSAGDVNADGIDDLIIGADRADPNGNALAGESYVVFGAAGVGSGGVINLSSLNGANGFVLNGIDVNDRSGRGVSCAGDVNGDGIDDLIIGARYADPNGNNEAGESYVVFGAADVGSGGVINLSSLNGANGFVLNGIDASDDSGRSVSSAGDVNGDGIDDLIIGARYADPNGNSLAGESYVVFGAAGLGSGGSINLSSLNGANGFVLNGIDPSDYSGVSVSCAGDMNGDGIDDLIIGAYFADPNGNSYAGESYVVFGAAGVGSGGVIELSSLNGTNGFVLNGIDPSDFSGISVSSAGDVNGDGIDDLIIGAYVADPNGNGGAGESYVVFGDAGDIVPTGLISISGASSALLSDDVTNETTIVLTDDSSLVILGTLFGNGVSGPGGGGTAGTVFIEGGVEPGMVVSAGGSAGVASFDGDLDLGATGTTIIQIGGTNPGVDLDQISAFANLGAGGTLQVTLVGGFAPSPGDVYQVLDFASVSGAFSNIVLDQALIDAGADTSNLLTTGVIVIPAPCLGDANMDGIVNFGDINAVLGNWLADYTPGTGLGDANFDGLVDFGDINSVLGNWLAVCP